jgi:hypothetical protein
MYRVRLVVAAATVALGTALAGCSGSSVSMPEWLTYKPPPPPTQALQFESAPPGAEVRSVQGQTCRTPCSLALPLTNQSVTFAMNGYVPQTVPVEVRQTERAAFDNSMPAADFSPNPVEVALQTAKPGKPGAKPKSRKTAATTDTAARTPAPPPTQTTASSAFPSLPPQQR